MRAIQLQYMVQFLIPLIDFIIAVGLATLPAILHYGYVNTMLLSLITWFCLAVNLWFLICNVDQSVDQFNNADPLSILCKYLNLIYYLDSILSNFFLFSSNRSTRSIGTVLDNILINKYKLLITSGVPHWYNRSFTCPKLLV